MLRAALAERWGTLSGRHGWLRWLAKWGVSVTSLLAGLVTLFIFRRGLPHVGWVVGYLILLWLLFTVFTQARQGLVARGHRLVLVTVDYTIQSLYHGLLLFVLPAYLVSTTFTSVNAGFSLLLVGVALLTTIDPWYRAAIVSHRSGAHALFTFSLFAALNVALPLVGVRPVLALFASALLAIFALTPSWRREGAFSWAGTWARAGGVALAALALLWWLRAWIPPAPLHLARATLARAVSGLEPLEPVTGSISAVALREWRNLVAYTAVYAPAGLNQPVAHVWRRNGEIVNVVPLSLVRGGRTEGFRTYSRKSDFGADPSGEWSVDVMTASGQLIGRLRFTVTP